jgi:hypothetical protein
MRRRRAGCARCYLWWLLPERVILRLPRNRSGSGRSGAGLLPTRAPKEPDLQSPAHRSGILPGSWDAGWQGALVQRSGAAGLSSKPVPAWTRHRGSADAPPLQGFNSAAPRQPVSNPRRKTAEPGRQQSRPCPEQTVPGAERTRSRPRRSRTCKEQNVQGADRAGSRTCKEQTVQGAERTGSRAQPVQSAPQVKPIPGQTDTRPKGNQAKRKPGQTETGINRTRPF